MLSLWEVREAILDGHGSNYIEFWIPSTELAIPAARVRFSQAGGSTLITGEYNRILPCTDAGLMQILKEIGVSAIPIDLFQSWAATGCKKLSTSGSWRSFTMPAGEIEDLFPDYELQDRRRKEARNANPSEVARLHKALYRSFRITHASDVCSNLSTDDLKAVIAHRKAL